MRALSAIAAVLGLAGLAAVPTAAAAADRGPGTARIVGGSPTTTSTYSSRWPWIVALVDSNEDDPRDGQFCGGSLIAADLVLTAAHCVAWPRYSFEGEFDIAKPAAVDVVAGQARLSATTGQRRDVAQIYVHPRHDGWMMRNDVALLRLATPVSGISPTSIVRSGEDALWGNGAGLGATSGSGPFIAGWGSRTAGSDDPYEYDTPNLPDLLHEAEVPIRSDDACEDGGPSDGEGYGREFDRTSMFCAGVLDTRDLNDANSLNNGIDSCYGDSGGPLIVSDGAGGWRVAGITSWGYSCAARRKYGIYTRVAAVRDWINSNPPAPVRPLRAPRLKGAALVYNSLTCGNGTWSGGEPITFSYSWERSLTAEEIQELYGDVSESILLEGFDHEDEEGGTSLYTQIEGATGQTLRLKPEQLGMRIRCTVKASNAGSAYSQRSNASAPVKEDMAVPRVRYMGTSCGRSKCYSRVLVRDPQGGGIKRVRARVTRVSPSGKRRRFSVQGKLQRSGRYKLAIPARQRGRYIVSVQAIDEAGYPSQRVRFTFRRSR